MMIIMNQEFIVQLITSVIVGGIFVAFQSLLAERVSQRTSGIILSIPSTLAVALFFIGLTISPEAVATATPVIPVSFGVGLMFCTVYVYVANSLQCSRSLQLVLSTAGATAVWLLLASPWAYFSVRNTTLSLTVYVLFVLIAQYFLAIRPSCTTTPIRIRYTGMQKFLRSAIGGGIIGFIIILAKYLNPFWGGIFSAFPAVFLSTLLIIHWHHSAHFLFHITKSLPLASPVFIIYTFTVQYSYPRFGLIIGTVLAFAVCALYPLSMTYIMGKRRSA